MSGQPLERVFKRDGKCHRSRDRHVMLRKSRMMAGSSVPLTGRFMVSFLFEHLLLQSLPSATAPVNSQPKIDGRIVGVPPEILEPMARLTLPCSWRRRIGLFLRRGGDKVVGLMNDFDRKQGGLIVDKQLEFHLPAPSATGEHPLVPARMVNEFVYCPRLAYLMWGQAEWAETGDTVDGRRVHTRVDRPNKPLPDPETLETEDNKIVSRSLTLSSNKLGVIAKIDIAEAEDGAVTPVDYKRGKRPHVAKGAYEPERVQVCLQALLLEEHGYKVEEGAVWYAESRERVRVVLDDELRLAAREAISRLRPDGGPRPYSAALERQSEMSALRTCVHLPAGRDARARGLRPGAPTHCHRGGRGAAPGRPVAEGAGLQRGRNPEGRRRGSGRHHRAAERCVRRGAVRERLDHNARARRAHGPRKSRSPSTVTAAGFAASPTESATAMWKSERRSISAASTQPIVWPSPGIWSAPRS